MITFFEISPPSSLELPALLVVLHRPGPQKELALAGPQ